MCGSPGDRTRLLAFADYLAERYAGRDVEFALRWMAASGRHPLRRLDVRRRPWVLVRLGSRTGLAKDVNRYYPAASVHPALFGSNGWSEHSYQDFGTYPEAVRWLSVQLAPLRDLLCLGDLMPPTP